MPPIIRPTSGNNTELGFSSPHRDNTSRSTQEKSIFTPRFRFAFVVTRSPRPISALSFFFSLRFVRFVCRRGFDVAVTKRNFRPVFEGIVLGKVCRREVSSGYYLAFSQPLEAESFSCSCLPRGVATHLARNFKKFARGNKIWCCQRRMCELDEGVGSVGIK